MKFKFLLILTVAAAMGLSSCIDSSDPNAQLNKEIREIDTYLNSLGTSDYIYYDPSGLRVVVHTFGEGVPPRQGQTVRALHEGRLFSTGALFTTDIYIDNKIENITPDALRFGLSILPKGSHATIYTPSTYGFGKTETATIPANSTLIYGIETTDIILTPLQMQKFIADSTTIHNYLIDNSIDAVAHSSGIWYTVDTPGAGNSPHIFNLVTFDYKLRLLNSATIIDQGTLSNQFISAGIIDGLIAALPLMQPNGVSTFYIPSQLAYGSEGKGSIPANANLVFEITLKSVDL